MDITFKSALDVVKKSLSIIQAMASVGENVVPALAVVTKGVTVINALIGAGESAAPAITALGNTFSSNKKSVTQEELDKCETNLDALIDEFNVPLPAEDA